MNTEQGLQLTDVLGVARRRGKLISAVAGAIVLTTFWIAMALPNLYSSSSVILVEPQSVDEKLIDSGVRDVELSERLGLMTSEILSRSRLSKIIDDVGLYEDESRYMQRSEVVDLMRSYVSVEPVLNAIENTNARNRDVNFNTFRISYQNEDATVAMQVAQLIANDFINANIDSRTEVTAKSLDFMQDEIQSLSVQIAEVERNIAELKAGNPGRLPSDLDSNKRILQFTMNDLRDAQRILDTSTSDAAFWKNQALTAGAMSAPNDTTSPGYRLRQLELEIGAMEARGFTRRHPDVIRLEAEIEGLKAQMAGRADGDDPDAPQTLSEQNARAEQSRAELRAKSASEDIARLKAVVTDIEARIGATPSVAEQLDAFQRQHDQLNESYQDFGRRLQQASVQADLERRQLGEKFGILESAFAAVEPSSPNRILLLVLGSVLGLGLGLGVGLLAEVADTSIHTSSDLQAAVGIPVLVSVPTIMLESDRVERSRRMIRELGAAAAVVVICLVGGFLTYRFVNGSGGASEADAERESPAAVEGAHLERVSPWAEFREDSTLS